MSDFKVVKLLDNPVVLNFTGGINMTGEYNNLVTYNAGESVSYQGGSYAAIQTSSGNLPTDTAFWQVLAEKGDQGIQGIQGESFQETYETVSKNLNSWDATINYIGTDLTTIIYSDGISTITKIFNYTLTDLTSIVLSGDTPAGISLTKTLIYTSGELTGVAYS
jgi:hypothetical protein